MARKYDELVYVERAESGFSNRQIARELGVDEATVRRGLERAGYKRHLLSPEVHAQFILDEPLRVTGDLMLTADWHVPLYDPYIVNAMIRTARREGITQLAIAGDFWNNDALSMYDPKQEEAGLEREWHEGLAVMRVLLETFDRIIFTWGNHDARLHKALGFKIQFCEAMRMMFGPLGDEAIRKIELSNLDHFWVDDAWYVCHPQSYSRIPLTAAIKLAAKVGANVITAHSHHCAVGYAQNGRHVVAEIGGLFDRHKTAYLQRSTTFPTWQQGFAFLKGGRLFVKSPDWGLI